MSTLRSLKKPKKHGKNIWFIILAAVLAAGILLGGIALSKRGDRYKVPDTVIRTEIVE